MILITGATGNNGTEILKRLAAGDARVRAIVRDRGRAGALASSPNVEVVEGDFDRPQTLSAALEGVERAFLLTPSSERAQAQQIAFVEAARQSGVAHVVKLSQFAADPNAPGRFQRYHAEVEAALRASGLAYTFLRPNLFMQGLLVFRESIAAQGSFYAAAGEARISMVDVRDIADAAVAALTEPGHEGKAYDLTGPRALTHAEMAEELSSALGRRVEFVDITPEAMREGLAGFDIPAWQKEGLVEDYGHYRRGEAASVAPGVRDATGKAPRDFEEFACDYAPMFS